MRSEAGDAPVLDHLAYCTEATLVMMSTFHRQETVNSLVARLTDGPGIGLSWDRDHKSAILSATMVVLEMLDNDSFFRCHQKEVLPWESPQSPKTSSGCRLPVASCGALWYGLQSLH